MSSPLTPLRPYAQIAEQASLSPSPAAKKDCDPLISVHKRAMSLALQTPKRKGSPDIVIEREIKKQSLSLSGDSGSDSEDKVLGMKLPFPCAFSASPLRSASPVFARSLQKVPATPVARSRVKPITSAFALKAMEIIASCSVTKEGRVYSIAPVAGLCGDHSQVYSITSPDALIEGVDNKDIFIKLYQHDVILLHSNRVETEFLKNSLEQYRDLLSKGLPVSTIYNAATAVFDGYLSVEKLSPFEPEWNADTKMEEMSLQAHTQIEQIKQFLLYAVQNSSEVPLDLMLRNLGMKKTPEGPVLALLDFTESSEDMPFAFRLIVRKSITDLSCGNPQLFEHLKEFCIVKAQEIGIDLKRNF